MELNKALEYVNQVKSGKRPHLDWNDWSDVEITLRDAGQSELAQVAHSEAMRAYHKEEYDADLL